jgi:pre-mRNA branch site protein p14
MSQASIPANQLNPMARRNVRLPPEVNRILYIRNLPYKISNEELYDIFGKFGPIRQIRRGVTDATKGKREVFLDTLLSTFVVEIIMN